MAAPPRPAPNPPNPGTTEYVRVKAIDKCIAGVGIDYTELIDTIIGLPSSTSTSVVNAWVASNTINAVTYGIHQDLINIKGALLS